MTATETDLGAQILAAAKEMAPRISARNEEIEQLRRLPDDMVQELKDAGILHMFLPRAYGGPEIDPLTAMEVEETLSYADGSVGWILIRALAGGLLFGGGMDPVGAAEIFDADPKATFAGTLNPPGEAITVDGGYRVSGRWPFGSGCRHATWMAGVCRVVESGETRLMENGQPELRGVVAPAHEFEILDTWHATGLRGTGSHDIQIRDVFVPEHFTYPMFPMQMRLSGAGPLFNAFPLNLFPTEGAFAVGVAQRAFDTFVGLAEEKTPFMATHVLREQPGTQEPVAEAHALISSARTYLYASARSLWKSCLAGEDGTPHQRMDVRLSTAHAMRSAVRAVDLIHSAAGTSAIYARSPIERCFRDLHTAEADVVVGPLVYRTAGRVLLGLPANNPNF